MTSRDLSPCPPPARWIGPCCRDPYAVLDATSGRRGSSGQWLAGRPGFREWHSGSDHGDADGASWLHARPGPGEVIGIYLGIAIEPGTNNVVAEEDDQATT